MCCDQNTGMLCEIPVCLHSTRMVWLVLVAFVVDCKFVIVLVTVVLESMVLNQSRMVNHNCDKFEMV